MGGSYDALIVNPGAWTHYSYAIADAIEMLSIPVVEVHLSKVMEREEFRKISVLEHVRTACFAGGGIEAYQKAMDYLKGEKDEKALLILPKEGFEEMEAVTPVDFLRRTGTEVVIAADAREKRVVGSHGIIIEADRTTDEIDELFDVVFCQADCPVPNVSRHPRA